MAKPTEDDLILKATKNFLAKEKQINDLKKAIKALEEERDLDSQIFIKEILDVTSSYNGYIPINSTTFLGNAKITEERKELGFYGMRFEMIGSQLTYTGKHYFISFKEWKNIPEEIKKLNANNHLQKNITFDKAPNMYLAGYDSGKVIASNQNLTLILAKTFLNAPSELLLFTAQDFSKEKKDIELEKELLDVISPLSSYGEEINKSKRFLGIKAPVHHILDSNVTLSKKFIDKHSSLIVTLFGEEELTNVYQKLANQKSLSKLKVKKNLSKG